MGSWPDCSPRSSSDSMLALANFSASGAQVIASSGGFLIEPGIGLMVWTLLVFGATMFLLSKLAFPRISAALGRRQQAIEDSIDTAQRTREEAEQILAEYRERLKEARAQSEEIVERARETAKAQEREGKEHAQELVAEGTKRAQREIEAATKQALGEIRKEVADLTIMATEKVTRKTLDDADQKRLVEEALGELDFSGISSGAANN
jgi:F-type H+-transporting ATPase subunit b